MTDLTDPRPDTPTPRNWTVLPATELRDGRPVVVDRARTRFEHVESLGEGAAGVVELTRDHDIDRLVAIKRLKDSEDPENVLRFTREVQALGRLDHPGIVPVHDVGRDDDGRYFIVMKHLSGETLDSIVQKLRDGDPDARRRYSVQERVRVCEATLRIMEFAHENGVIHRDLKPSNIMIGQHGEVTIVDWGLSKQIDESDEDAARQARVDVDRARPIASAPIASNPVEETVVDGGGGHETHANARMGTPLYMSPEQARGAAAEVGVPSDLYTLGVVFYEFLSLRHYLEGRSEIHEILDGVVHEPARFAFWNMHEGEERLPIELAYWLKTSMSKSIVDRFESARAMREELQRVVEGRFAVVCPTTFTRRLFRFGMDSANRRPIVVLLGLLVAFGLAAFGAISLVMRFAGG